MKKRIFVAILALVLALAMTSTVFADTPNLTGKASKADPIQPAVKTAFQKNAVFTTNSISTVKHNNRVYGGKDYIVTAKSANNDTYLYYKPTSTGYIHVGLFTGYVTLCNSSKKAISKKIWVNVDSTKSYYKYASFAVKKNTGYYLRFQNSARGLYYDSPAFGLHIYKFAVNEYSGSTKSSSKTIKYNTLKKGTVLSGVSYKADYYKFYSNKSSFKLTFQGFTSGTVYAYVTHYYNGKTYTKKMQMTRAYNQYNLTAHGLGKGTWYVKVYRASSLNNGYYTLKWK